MSSPNLTDNTTASQSEQSPPKNGQPKGETLWFCPSRWLLAHHDYQAAATTMSSHMCLVDLIGDGDSLLAFIDFKRRATSQSQEQQTNPGQMPNQSPYDCRLRVYRNQQLIYNHFLDDIPACLLTVASRIPVGQPAAHGQASSKAQLALSRGLRLVSGSVKGVGRESPTSFGQGVTSREVIFLAAPINDHIYFYQKLNPSHRWVLEDEPCIMNSLQKSEFEAWQMVKQNKVDIETLCELLTGLRDELGASELTSHSNNFLALTSEDERKNYLLMWKFKGINGNGTGESLMSMDTICCAANRSKFSRNSGGDQLQAFGSIGQQSSSVPLINSPKVNMLLNMQQNGLVLGTEDRHLLIYEIRGVKSHLEAHYRLPSTPDHILIECRSPATFPTLNNIDELDTKNFTYKIIVSCRNCHIYTINQTYLVTGTGAAINQKKKEAPSDRGLTSNCVQELLSLSCSVLDMCWTGDEPVSGHNQPSTGITNQPTNQPDFVVACADRKVYCFNSGSGHCKWVVELEMPITCIVCLPHKSTMPQSNDSYNLIGVASQANRIDFYISSSGRIVDSIYLSESNYCQAMTFGRFGREDNCLCATTNMGHLLIFILKRTAKFGHGQCLSSAASHASSCLAKCRSSLRQKQQHPTSSKSINFKEPPNVPSVFSLATRSAHEGSSIDEKIESLLHSDHNCDTVLARSTLDSIVLNKQLMQPPPKSRNFVDQIVDQSLHSTAISRVFAKHMVQLRDKVCAMMEQQSDLKLAAAQMEDGNRLTLTRISGLGNTFRVTLSLRLNLMLYADRHHLLSGTGFGTGIDTESTSKIVDAPSVSKNQQQQQQQQPTDFWGPPATVSVLLFTTDNKQQCRLKPFRFELQTAKCSSGNGDQWLLDRTIEFKLVADGRKANTAAASILEPVGDQQLTESVSLDVYALLRCSQPIPHLDPTYGAQPPVFISSINIPCTC